MRNVLISPLRNIQSSWFRVYNLGITCINRIFNKIEYDNDIRINSTSSNFLIEYYKSKIYKYMESSNQMSRKSIRKKKIPVALRNSVWNTYIGEALGIGKCFICQGQITHSTFACGHIVAEAKGGETKLDNLRPVCPSCNSSQGTANMIEFKKGLGIRCPDIPESSTFGPEDMSIEDSVEEKFEEMVIEDNKIEHKQSAIHKPVDNALIIEKNIKKLDNTKIKVLKNKKILRHYISEWFGIENYQKHGLLDPSKSEIISILYKFDKNMLKIICDDLSIPYTKKNKKDELIDIILDKN